MDRETKVVLRGLLGVLAGIWAEQRCFMAAISKRLEEREITSAAGIDLELARVREEHYTEQTKQLLGQLLGMGVFAALREEGTEDAPQP